MCTLTPNFRFSFSKLQLYDHCPMAFKLQYIDNPYSDTGNAFSDFGSFCHTLLQKWAVGKLPDFMLEYEYDKGYEAAIQHDFPPFPSGSWQKYRQQGHDYFASFHGFGDNYQILSAEEKFVTTFAGHPFSGIADLILRDKDTKEIIVIDHKSKSESAMKAQLNVYRKQLYIYAHAVMQKYGVFPSKLVFNGFRQGYWYEEQFSAIEYVNTIKWIGDTINKIMAEPDWIVCANPYYCRYICGSLNDCPAKDAVLYPPPKMLTFGGVQKTVKQWAQEYGLTPATITKRINKGMTVEQALTTPVGRKRRRSNDIG